MMSYSLGTNIHLNTVSLYHVGIAEFALLHVSITCPTEIHYKAIHDLTRLQYVKYYVADFQEIQILLVVTKGV